MARVTVAGMTAAGVAVALLAAGRAARMRGRDKLLEKVDGEPLLRRQARAALAASDNVFVMLGPGQEARAAALAGVELERLEVHGADEGMSASIRVAAEVAARRGTAGLMILPADMPELTAQDLRDMIAAFTAAPDSILRGAAADGRPGHPVIFPRDLYPELGAVAGDAGAHALVARHAARLRLLPLPDAHAVTDLDTPEDWARWRARRGEPR